MKRILSATLLLLFLVLPLYAQISNLKEGNLQGKVKSVKLNHRKVMVLGDSIWSESAADNDPFWFNGYIDTYFVFDREGRTSEYHTYFDADADDNKTLNIYNEEGLLKEQRFSADGRKNGSMKYKYDGKGRITEVVRYDAKGEETDRISHIREPHRRIPKGRGHNNIWVYNYDENDRCIEEKCLLPNGRISFRNIFFYDEEGRQTTSVFFDKDNIQNVTTSFDYDPQGRIKSIIKISPTKKLVTRYKYDEFNNIIYTRTREVDVPSERGKDEKEDRSSESSFVYQYDETGNWIQKIVYNNGVPEYIQEREITYY
ncbi:MAG: hypothetical protein RR202_12245 [Bacteroidales bacterium]